jgi:hypothetical protein
MIIIKKIILKIKIKKQLKYFEFNLNSKNNKTKRIINYLKKYIRSLMY